jgi:hypothetical protein
LLVEGQSIAPQCRRMHLSIVAKKALKNALDQITESDITGWFQHCGYSIAPK